MITPTNEEIAALIKDYAAGLCDPWVLAGKMADALEALSKEREWKPVDTAPTNVAVLLYSPDRGIANEERIELDFYRTERNHSGSVHSWATHWRDLPLPPPSTEKEGDAA
jgi:hypothetical protein